MDTPTISVIIVNWDHGHLIQDCLDALLAQEYPACEVLVVDNGSQDGSPEEIAAHYPTLHLQAFSQNLGFSRAFNWGVRHTEGSFILSLNPDTVVQDGFLQEMLHAAGGHGEESVQIGIVAPKLRSASDPAILDSTGLFVDRRRRPYDRGQGEADKGQYDEQIPVFGACGAAALYRRSMLMDVVQDGEYFDESFFAYYEDADLAWRAQLRGWGCVYAPRAVATHVRGSGDTLRKAGQARKGTRGPRLALRNRYLMTAKNDTWRHFLSDLPWILAAELPRWAYAALTKPTVLLGLLDLARALPSALAKRRQIQQSRLIDDRAIRRWFLSPKLLAGDS